jgi:crotonobetainyl-CoA:carnitine CoA-transferase CaiB-like acyl-CoA transferase
MSEPIPFLPLEGIVVVELSHMIAAPLTGQILAAHGATVIKVEPPQGDAARELGPPGGTGHSILFEAFNRGKSSLALDLHTSEGKARLSELLEGAHVFLTNYREEALARLGIDATSLLHQYPTLVCAYVTGSADPEDRSPTVDITALARAGLLSDGSETGEPRRPNAAVADLTAGLYLALEITSCLLQPGIGRVVRVPLADISFFVGQLGMTNASVGLDARSDDPNLSPFGLSTCLRTLDGWIAIAAPSDRLFARLCDGVGRPDLVTAFPTADHRRARATELVDELQAAMSTWPTSALVAHLRGFDVPCESVHTSLSASKDPYLLSSGLTGVNTTPGLLQGLPVIVDGRRIPLRGSVPGRAL